MLKHRILSAMVLIPLVLWIILYGHPWILGGLVAVVLAIAADEWMRLIPLQGVLEKVAYGLLLLGLTFIAWRYDVIALVIGVALWCVLVACILAYPNSQKLWGRRFVVAGWGGVLLPVTYISLANIYHHARGSELLIYLLFLVWAADTGGYFVGKKWGQKRLIPRVSPGKTLAGVLGGGAFLLGVSVGGALWFQPSHLEGWFSVAGVIFVAALFGDLFVSMLKRRVNLKDTGTLIPGHGGVLDRIDSLIAAVPVFSLALFCLPEWVR